MAARIAVIGAEPSGMSQLRAFHMAEQQEKEISEVGRFEKQAVIVPNQLDLNDSEIGKKYLY